ncbi:MAG: SLBB domain-containing protein, partial [Deltaproteobacteria bacterium]|nr:SLBB domain-containing protein [Deltaproteobacteria bacterium]
MKNKRYLSRWLALLLCVSLVMVPFSAAAQSTSSTSTSTTTQPGVQQPPLQSTGQQVQPPPSGPGTPEQFPSGVQPPAFEGAPLRTLYLKEKLKVFPTLSDEEKVAVFEGLSDQEKILLFRNLSDKERASLYTNLSTEVKDIVFRSLSPSEKLKLFANLDDQHKADLFSTLSDQDKLFFFRNISDQDKIFLFANLRYQDKQNLLNSLSPEERAFILKYIPVPLTKPEELLVRPPAPAEVEEELSPVEKIMSGEIPTEISRELRQYGYDFFTEEISAFTPLSDIPVGNDYVIGPGDNFEIHLWGKVEQSYSVTVNRDGQIILPRIGAVTVSGLTYSEMKRHLDHKFREYYPDFDMTITMGQLRTIQVYVVGEAQNPGTYSLSSLSTVITALFATGGPNKNGSMRHIRLLRNGQQVKEIDLYDFFLKGNKRQDARLEPGDTIFIPVIGPVVGVAGNVKRPAIYEMKGSQTIGQAIEMAGGLLPIGHLQNVVVERIQGHKQRVVKSFNLDPTAQSAEKNLQTLLSDGDVIKIYPIYKKLDKVVYLEGNVKYPREYELKPGMRVSDLIPSYDALLPESYMEQAEIIRLAPPDLHPEIIQFNLGRMLQGSRDDNPLLQDLDRVRVYNRWEKKQLPQVTIKGEVRNPGSYRLYDGM